MKQTALTLALVLGVALGQRHTVTATYYWAVPGQTDTTPRIASCGPLDAARLHPGWRIVALSRDLFFRENGRKRCGEIVFLKLETGHVIYGVVWDTMAKRFRRRIDILVPVGYRPVWGKARGILELVDGY